VVLDQAHDLRLKRFSHSSFMGKVPISKVSSEYRHSHFRSLKFNQMEYLEMVFKISAVAREIARQIKERRLTYHIHTAIHALRPGNAS
jgi:hypothetical protein